MATVVLAEDTTLGRLVALKRMNTEGDVRGLSRLRREALVGASLSHPNLVPIYDVVATEDGGLIIVMEYVDGETLHAAMRREPRLSVAAGLRVLDGVSAALDAIHRRGIVHRDVKPANILLGSDGSIKLADLGIASVSDRTRITTDGAVLGTFSYMAPEQLGGAQSSAAVDIYALSAVAFEVLSRRKARCEPNPLALAHAISTQPPPDLLEAWPEAPRAAAAVLVAGMSRDPRERPSSAGELTGRLRGALETHPTAPMPVVAAVSSPAPPRPEAREAPSKPEALKAPPERSPPPPGEGPAAAAGPIANRSDGKGDSAERREASVPVAPAERREASVPVAPAERRETGVPAAPAVRRFSGSRRDVLVAGLITFVAVAAVLALVLSGGASQRGATSRATASRHSSVASGRPRTTARAGSPATPATTNGAGANGAGSPPTSPSAGTATGGPVAAVESFYHLAAAHRYDAAWALADPSFRGQLRGYQSFKDGQAGERSITFGPTRLVGRSGAGATVALQTTSVRTDGTSHCRGTVDLLPGASPGSWRLHQIHITCSPGG